MPANRSTTSRGTEGRTRRQILAALGAGTAVSIAGCSDVLSGRPAETGSAEVVVENRTTEAAEIAVRLTDGASETLFSRVFTVGPEAMIGRGSIDSVPARVHAFTPAGVSHWWDYDPDLPADFDCEIKDVGLALHGGETIEPWYKC
jgi:hypothetical protein